MEPLKAKNMIFVIPEMTKPNLLIIIGSIIFVIFTLAVGTSNVKFSQEIVFVGSFTIILFLLIKLSKELDANAKKNASRNSYCHFCF